MPLKPLDTFGTVNKQKSSQIYKLLEILFHALLFEKKLKQLSILVVENYGFILKPCHDTAKRAETRVGFHRFVILYISCDTRNLGL